MFELEIGDCASGLLGGLTFAPPVEADETPKDGPADREWPMLGAA